MVEQSLDRFKILWRERKAQRRTKTDWTATDVVPQGEKKKKTDVNEEALSPGSIVKIALGERFKSVNVYIKTSVNSRTRPSLRSEWHRKLCKVLVGLCRPDGGTGINPSAIKETPNHLSYLKVEVHGNQTFVGNVLQWREIGFVVEIYGRKNEVIKKHFAINLHSKRFRRSSFSGDGTILTEHEFPDYDQHECCGCKSGCSPVAWAQVFGYYDRRASWYENSIFSSTIYGDNSTMAPLSMTSGVKRFVEDIRTQLETFCMDGEGATYRSKMNYVAKWFQARQGSKARVVSYLPSRKKRWRYSSVQQGGSPWIRDKVIEDIKLRYPVVLSITTENGGHSVVATKYKRYSRSYRVCHSRETTGWWFGRRTKEECSWKTAYDYEFFLHWGWGGRNNKWLEVTPVGAYNAYIAK